MKLITTRAVKFAYVFFTTAILILQPNITASEIHIFPKPSVPKKCSSFKVERNGELTVIKKFISDGDRVFDVGANIGDWSVAVLKSHADITITAFEPIPKVYQQLRNNLAKWNHVIFENVALSNKTGTSSFNYYPKHSELSGIARRPILDKLLHALPEKITVKTQTLDEYCASKSIQHIDFLKIDTEGEEVSILNGAKSLIENHAISKIQFEYGGCFKDSKHTLKEACELLSQNGYVIFEIYPKGLAYIDRWSERLEDYKYTNFIAILESALQGYSPMIMNSSS